MYLQSGLGRGTSAGRRACAVPATVTLRKLVLNDGNRTAIGAALGLGRAATTTEVRTIITDAAQRAVELIGRAAWPLRRPRATGAAGEPMRLHFREAFGTMPEFVPAWRPAGERWDTGAVVRERLRCAAKILAGGDIEFVAWGPGSCPFRVRWGPDTWAWVQEGRYRICLGAAFWNSNASLDERATTLVHESLHIYFSTIEDEEGRGPYNRAACYERYVLISNKLPISDYVGRVCPSNAPVGDFPVPVRRGTAVAGLGTVGQSPAMSCAPERGEIAASLTNAGILTKDVELTDKGVLVTDFGVDRRSVKPGAKAELGPTLDLLEKDDIKTIRITGFDDCLNATPQMHRYVRKHRALRVLALLGPKARAKVAFAGGAPLGTFVGPNTDRAARARNRSVLIEYVAARQPKAVTLPLFATKALPPSEAPRFDRALERLRVKIATDIKMSKASRQTLLCWREKLEAKAVDDRVIMWSRICPSTSGAVGAATVVGPCDLLGNRPSQKNIEDAFSSAKDVDSLGESVGIFTYVKTGIVVADEMTSQPLENLLHTKNEAFVAVHKLNEWANNQMGGSSAMPKAYRAIKDWLQQRQNDRNSLYACP